MKVAGAGWGERDRYRRANMTYAYGYYKVEGYKTREYKHCGFAHTRSLALEVADALARRLGTHPEQFYVNGKYHVLQCPNALPVTTLLP